MILRQFRNVCRPLSLFSVVAIIVTFGMVTSCDEEDGDDDGDRDPALECPQQSEQTTLALQDQTDQESQPQDCQQVFSQQQPGQQQMPPPAMDDGGDGSDDPPPPAMISGSGGDNDGDPPSDEQVRGFESFSMVPTDHFGEIEVQIVWQNEHLLNSAELRYRAGTIAPTCNEGEIAETITDFSTDFNATLHSYPGYDVTFRLCIYDDEGLIDEKHIPLSTPDGHRVFVTSATFNGALTADAYGHGSSFATGPEGADFRCQYLADQANLGGNWIAMLADPDHYFAVTRNYGATYNLHPSIEMVWDHDGFLSSTPGAAIDHDETGNALGGVEVWTGSGGGMSPSYTDCDYWSNNTGSYSGMFGLSNDTTAYGDLTGDFSSTATCDNAKHLYCLSYPESIPSSPDLVGITATPGADDGDVTVAVDFPDEIGFMTEVRVYHVRGEPDPSYDYCGSSRETLLHTWTTNLEDRSFVHTIGSGYHHYRACAYDQYGYFLSAVASDVVLEGTDDFLRAFVTSTSFSADLTAGYGTHPGAYSDAHEGADDRCTQHATAAGFGGTWKAVLSTSTLDAADKITLTGQLYSLQNYYIGSDADDIWTYPGNKGFRARIDTDEDGNTFASTKWYMTGSAFGGVHEGSPDRSCSDFTSTASAPISRGTTSNSGYSGHGGSVSTTGCTFTSNHLLCFQVAN